MILYAGRYFLSVVLSFITPLIIGDEISETILNPTKAPASLHILSAT